MDISNEELKTFASRTQRPIAGQSLTGNPDTPWAWEKAPKFTKREEAINHFFDYFTEEERYEATMDILEDGVSVMEIVELVLTNSFQKGDINPDMLMLLAEPVAYILIGLAERAGIKALINDDDDVEDMDEEDKENFIKSKFKTIEKPKGDEEGAIDKKLEELPSLLAMDNEVQG
tara:strand:+ start:1222 stop:1746 length:525 start_codon:yes stop_codon:yes gene_type:complete